MHCSPGRSAAFVAPAVMRKTLAGSLALFSLLLLVPVADAAATEPHAPSVVERTEGAVVRGVKAATRGVEHGAQAATRGVEHGAKAAAGGVERGAQAAARGVERGAEATARTARRVSAKIVGTPASPQGK